MDKGGTCSLPWAVKRLRLFFFPQGGGASPAKTYPLYRNIKCLLLDNGLVGTLNNLVFNRN